MVSSRKQANVDATVAELVANGLVAIGVPCHVGKADERTKLVAATVYVIRRCCADVNVLSHPLLPSPRHDTHPTLAQSPPPCLLIA